MWWWCQEFHKKTGNTWNLHTRLDNDLAFNEQDNLISGDNEHHVSKGVVPELKDIVSDGQSIELDDIDPNHKEVNKISTHPSGRPVRKVTGKGRPMDDQYIYEL